MGVFFHRLMRDADVDVRFLGAVTLASSLELSTKNAGLSAAEKA